MTLPNVNSNSVISNEIMAPTLLANDTMEDVKSSNVGIFSEISNEMQESSGKKPFWKASLLLKTKICLTFLAPTVFENGLNSEELSSLELPYHLIKQIDVSDVPFEKASEAPSVEELGNLEDKYGKVRYLKVTLKNNKVKQFG